MADRNQRGQEDGEPLQRWPLDNISECQVQHTSHRKQGPVLPTLVITISDSQRKRRSSRATGFISSNKDSGVATLWFRTPPDDHHRSLQEWAQLIMVRKGLASAHDSPVSPVFASPFKTRSNEYSDYLPRSASDSRGLQHTSSTATYSTGPLDRAGPFDLHPPSLRSKRSDVSSPSDTNRPTSKIPYATPEQHYTTVLPGDILPSSPNGEYPGRFVEGWTSAAGRSSVLGFAVRGRDSLSSQGQHASIPDVTSPPAPGETILDRAFLLGHIPGAGSYVPGQEKLSSIARFDALMREAEDRKGKREASRQSVRTAVRSAFDDDDSSDEEEAYSAQGDHASEGSDRLHDQSQTDQGRAVPDMSPSAQRALAFITSRHHDGHAGTHRPTVSRTHLSFHAGVTPAFPVSPPVPPSRPHTAHAKSRSNAARNRSTLQLMPATTTTLDLTSAGKSRDDGSWSATVAPDKRNSSSSAKRLSFTDFTKRLSSTSSLLLVQTNVSAGSSHVGSETDTQNGAPPSRTSLALRGGPPLRTKDREELDRRCGWRGSVGVVGTEGGFL
ncbi:hypothetical protein AAL_03838 [Moelleriella libera RCEF 2490]|uniref:Uncharacterized protein n=1 Tax=Moelleriella libera RCEF 2490 TaxID=1081109 RepID=A0A168CHJ5_9HYPO|nr:hypothetical protein AAL_03838 [Moelleriella libera RCEF 2490]